MDNDDLVTELEKSTTDNNFPFSLKPDCKYCEPTSQGVFGVHYACFNKQCKQYRSSIPFCCGCDCKEK